jgi:transposase
MNYVQDVKGNMSSQFRCGRPLARWTVICTPLPPCFVACSTAKCGATPPGWPWHALNSRLDIVVRVDTITFTVIRRSPKPDPKLRALQESGSANPYAHVIQDPAFVDSDFFDPHDLIQVRYEMLRRVRTEGQSITKATTLFGVSRPTFYKLQSDFTRSGLVGLLPAKRGPRGPRKITPDVLRFIEEAAASEEKLDAQHLAARIAQRFGRAVHWRTVKRALARLKKKPDESPSRQPGRSCVGCALRGAATGRRGLDKHLSPLGARIGAVHAQRDGGMDEERHRRTVLPRCDPGDFIPAANALEHGTQPDRYRGRHGLGDSVGGSP